jgi:hypothetical protein
METGQRCNLLSKPTVGSLYTKTRRYFQFKLQGIISVFINRTAISIFISRTVWSGSQQYTTTGRPTGFTDFFQ